MKSAFKLVQIFTLALLVTIPFKLKAQNLNAFAVQTKIKNGIIEGSFDTKSGIQKFFGIPFAKPPVGELRWKAPQPLDNWSGIKKPPNLDPGQYKLLYLETWILNPMV
ncbi:carboxylesterase family protein [Algoriphagus halophilus]